jgi:hypothetical protein
MELPLPAAAVMDDKSIELIRVWAAAGTQHVSIASNLWEDPAAWGLVLVDLAKRLAVAYRQTRGDDPHDVLRRIREGFDAEWDAPAGDAGSIVS